jgi:hypothetical protein
MKITLDNLIALKACPDGIAAFSLAYPSGFNGDWTKELQIALIQGPLSKHMGWAWSIGLMPMWSMLYAKILVF